MRPNTIGAYSTAPSFAWSGWRLRPPGGPIGGQYHGYIASDDIVDGVGWPAGAAEIYRPGDPAGLGAVRRLGPPVHDPHRHFVGPPIHIQHLDCDQAWKEYLAAHPLDCDALWKQYHAAHFHDPDPWRDFRRLHANCPADKWADFLQSHPDCDDPRRAVPALHGLGASVGPWEKIWSGTALTEGQTHSDHVYRSPAEIRPRPNASGGVNVVHGHQTMRSAGFAVAPGNYKGIGDYEMPEPAHNGSGGGGGDGGGAGGGGLNPGGGSGWGDGVMAPSAGGAGSPGGPTGYSARGSGFTRGLVRSGDASLPIPFQRGAYHGPGAYRTIGPQPYGATNIVPQPMPPTPAPTYVTAWSAPPISPAPAPTVAAGPSNFLPSQGQLLPADQVPGTGQTVQDLLNAGYTQADISTLVAAAAVTPGATSSSATSWLDSDSLWTGVANKWLLLGGIVGFGILRGRK